MKEDNKRLRELKRQIATKMGYKMNLRTRMPGKDAMQDFFKANVDKKKLPTHHSYPHTSKDPSFARMSIEEFEKKYL